MGDLVRSYGHFSLDGVNCDVCTKREGRIVTLTECTGVDDGTDAEPLIQSVWPMSPHGRVIALDGDYKGK